MQFLHSPSVQNLFEVVCDAQEEISYQLLPHHDNLTQAQHVCYQGQ